LPLRSYFLDGAGLKERVSMADFFNQDMAKRYDERNSKLAAISDSLHFLTRLVLADLPARASILSVGVGTGAEILALARAQPSWTFVGVDPSLEMLEVCRHRLAQQGMSERCELIHGHAQDAPKGPRFDAALSMLVAHFIAREARSGFYSAILERLKPEGYFVSAEISADLDGPEFPAMLKNWEQVQALMGATPESLRTLDNTLRHALNVVSPAETTALWQESGFSAPVQFFQAFMIGGWYAQKR
jgi:tRNA (cmo5U34)-methyltransferase